MPRIIVEADAPDGGAARVTLVERLVPHDLHNDHYLAQLVQRLGWAALDAETLESVDGGQERA